MHVTIAQVEVDTEVAVITPLEIVLPVIKMVANIVLGNVVDRLERDCQIYDRIAPAIVDREVSD